MNEVLTNPVIQVSGTAKIEPCVEVAALCEIKDDRAVTTSLKVAEIFNKKHKNVVRDINALDCSPEFRGLNFEPSEYPYQNGNIKKMLPMYFITRDGFVFLVMGFTGKTAAKFKEAYINAFNVMEERLRRQQEEELRLRQTRSSRTMAEMPTMVRESLEHGAPVVESFGRQRVVSSVTLARLQGKEHRYVCDCVRRMFKHVLRPGRMFIRQARAVRKGYGRGYESGEGVVYYITIEGFNTMRTHSTGLSDEVAQQVMAAFREAKGKNRPGQPNPSTPKMPPTPPDEEPTATAAELQGPTMPKDAADMMRRMVQAMAVLMGVDVNEVSNLISGGRK